MSDEAQEYRGGKLVVRFDGKACVHARNCVLGRPEVFQANVPGPWIAPDAAAVEAVVSTALACPSGAITFERLDGGAAEQPPPVNLVRVRENGPLAVHAELQIAGQPARHRATLCRCGASQNKPYCDASHVAAGFTATGEPATVASEPLARRGGALTVTPSTDGPLLVSGSVEVVSGTGRTLLRTTKTAFCRCGGSQNKPYCDGSHRTNGFKST
jgi:CDGSH-type Zn-finger protein/uncharacterized Fe-S cluster protein YjdI